MAARSTLVGIVGYTPILDKFPLGPKLKSGLEEVFVDEPHISVKNFTWSPIHIVQKFESNEMPRPERIVLVGLSTISATAGGVQAFRWQGGQADELAVQERVYEAVTGIVDLENTLMIGEYFKAWPDECFTVEADIPADTFGRLVIAGSEGWGNDEKALISHFGFSLHDQRKRIIETTSDIARNGCGTKFQLSDKSSKTLTPVHPFTKNHTLKQSGVST